MKFNVALIMFVLATLGVSVWAVSRSWHGRYLLTRSTASVRDALFASRQLNQNSMFPGCGNGREDANQAFSFVQSLAQSDPGLIRSFTKDSRAEVRAAAAMSLGEVRDQGSASAIFDLMTSDSDPKLRADAAGALRQLDLSKMQDRLAKLQASKDPLTRACAYCCTKQIDKEALAWLTKISTGDFDIRGKEDLLAMHVAWSALHR